MSESTTTTTTTETTKTTPKRATSTTPSSSKDKWRFAGYWNVLIGAFVLIIQGFLTFFWQLAPGLWAFIGTTNFFVLSGGVWAIWFNAVVQMLLGMFILILIWEVVQRLLNTGVLIKDIMWLGIVLLVIGLITMGPGGILVLLGSVFYLLSIPK